MVDMEFMGLEGNNCESEIMVRDLGKRLDRLHAGFLYGSFHVKSMQLCWGDVFNFTRGWKRPSKQNKLKHYPDTSEFEKSKVIFYKKAHKDIYPKLFL